MKKILVVIISVILMSLLVGCKDSAPTATIDGEGTENIIVEETITEKEP